MKGKLEMLHVKRCYSLQTLKKPTKLIWLSSSLHKALTRVRIHQNCLGLESNGVYLFCEILYLSLCCVHSSLMRERTLNAVSSILLSRLSSWLTIRCKLVTSRVLAPWFASQNRSISERTSSNDRHTSLKSLCEGRMERGGLCSGRRENPSVKRNQFDRFNSWNNLP